MIVVGLTGGIATGKTTITNFLKKNKFAVHDSDAVVKTIYSKPPQAFIKHLKDIGLGTTIRGKKINKNTIREVIFSNQKKKKELEKYIHKEVKKSRDKFLTRHRIKKTKIVILDIPLLFEAKLSYICDYVILLYLPRKLKIRRALARKGMKKDILLKIIENQLNDSYKKKRADFIINTSKTKKHSFKMILGEISNIIDQNA